ncbi:P-type conjugative transfer protein TrbJ [Silvibacterium sp.]|uniref:P-type conjugative transfer protein TrbJ n=1 Tax=Silvibacterium sp. TaxID=1964179 RepID=UPI0039E6886D
MPMPKVIAPAVIVLLLTSTTVPPARAGGLLEATLPEQLVQEVTLAEQLTQAAQQYQTQLQQWENEIKQGQLLSAQSFSQVQSQLTGIQGVVQGGNALSYAMANYDSQFTARFASLGYEPATSYASRYAQWSQTSMANTQKMLDAAGYQNEQVTSQAALIAKLQSDSQTAQGQNQAIQVGNEIAAEEVNQLLQLRELMMADMQSKASFQAQQIAQTDEQNRALGFFQGTQLYKPY